MKIENLNKPQLQALAKKFNIDINQKKNNLIFKLSKINADVLNVEIKRIVELEQENSSIKQTLDLEEESIEIYDKNKKFLSLFLQIMALLVSSGILLINMINRSEKQKIETCDNYTLDKFSDTISYNILLFDFLDYTNCNSYEDCEAEFKTRISQINTQSHVPISVRIENCKSSDLGIFSINDAKKIAIETNSNLVIYGGIEEINEDSLIINLNYTTNPRDTIVFKTREDNNLIFGIKSIFEISSNIIHLEELDNLIYWNLADRSLKEGGVMRIERSRKYLNKISNLSKRDYSNAKVKEGILNLYVGDLDGARTCFKTAMNRDSTNAFAYVELGFVNIIDEDYNSAVKNIQRYSLLRFFEGGHLDSINTDKLKLLRKESSYPMNLIHEYEKDNNYGLGCSQGVTIAHKWFETSKNLIPMIDYCVKTGFKSYIEDSQGKTINELKKEISNTILVKEKW